MLLLQLWSNSKMLLNNGNEFPHRCWACRKKQASSPCSPASTIWVYIWSQEAPGRPQTVWLSLQTSTQQLGFLSKAYSTYLSLLGQQNGAGTLLSTGICLTLLALLPEGWRYCRNHPSLSAFPIVRVAGGWKRGDAQHAGWKRKVFKPPGAEFTGKTW